jgi:hypothetical protein
MVMATVMIAEATIPEGGLNSDSGDQGKEVRITQWYSHPWNRVLRAPSISTGEKIAKLAEAAARNDHIGYSSGYSRSTYWQALNKSKYDPSKITKNCNTDCSAFVAATVKACGYLLKEAKAMRDVDPNLTTRNIRVSLKNVGFKELTDNKYLKSSDYLAKGDIIIHDATHCAICLGGGIKENEDENAPSENVTPSTDGSSGTEDDGITVEDFAIEEYFATSQQAANPTKKDYMKNLNSEPLKIKDIRGILGMPHQFLPTTDIRINDKNNVNNDNFSSDCMIGRVYADRIVSRMPLLLITPGIPSFMSAFSKENKKSVLKALFKADESNDIASVLSEGSSGRYYTLKFAYVEYTKYLNAMLRSAAYFLGIENETIDGRKLGNFNWLYYTTETNTTGEDGTIFTETGVESNLNTSKFLGPYAGCIAMYADCGTSVDDSFSNSTTQSQLSSTLNSLSDTGRELNFLIGNVGSNLGLQLDKLSGAGTLDENVENIQDEINRILGGGNIMSNILGKATRILAGGRMVFPEIWSDSSFSRSYSCKMKLVSPSGDKLSVFLNILVPIYHLLALALPRQSDGQTYYSPFLVRAFCQSMFNVDMGIITDLNVTKGAEGEWTINGLPTVAEVSFSIKDMYESLMMTKVDEQWGKASIMKNVAELDYIANSCGININDHEIARTAKMYLALGFNPATKAKDFVQLDLGASITQWVNQKIQNVFGVF